MKIYPSTIAVALLVIGGVALAQTIGPPNNAIPAGTAIIGKVGVDQTTPGTTNAVSLAQLGANTVLTGNGATGTGALRVSIASDSTGIVALPAAGTSVVGTKAAGTAAATSLLSGGVYNSTVLALTDGQQAANQSDTTGARSVNVEGKKASYRVIAQDIAQTAAGVMTQITGSASKTIRITRIKVTGYITTAVNAQIIIYKTSATSTGTQAAITPTKLDSGNAAATAAAASIATPTGTGASLGVIETARGLFPTSATVGDKFDLSFGDKGAQAFVLRGTAEFAGVSFATDSGTYTGIKVSVIIEFTEE